ncbi:hypothetical protein [Winogradskyella sp.]|uniref:hypothetical protein n=1 Tax=Winogradskyella sp. TaxID=1883156 RepID=UPI0025DBAE13|nr:hypothetical protein [Winogradskyella sp.]MBT8244413.1 hypothetical protein [Winogradskyella sp.]
MKTIYLFLSLTLLSLSSIETNVTNPFVGIWEYQEGNTIFRVELYMTDDDLRGHYEKVEVGANGLEILIFKSNRDVGHGLTLGPVIYGDNTSTILNGGIEDVTIETQPNLPIFTGKLKMEIISSSPTTATWKVTLNGEGRSQDDNREFSIPTDVIMTKVE